MSVFLKIHLCLEFLLFLLHSAVPHASFIEAQQDVRRVSFLGGCRHFFELNTNFAGHDASTPFEAYAYLQAFAGNIK